MLFKIIKYIFTFNVNFQQSIIKISIFYIFILLFIKDNKLRNIEISYIILIFLSINILACLTKVLDCT